MIIGMCGLIGTGKDTVADVLVREYNFKKISFADKLKDGVATVFGWNRDMLEGKTDESRKWREATDKFWSEEVGKDITPRLILQLFGTDCMRNGFFDGIWVSLVKQEILAYPDNHYVIPDVRFENEAQMIKSINGEVWRIRRGPDPDWFKEYLENNVVPKSVHQSEWRWAKLDFDHIVYNDDSIEALRSQVSSHLASTSHLFSA